MTLVANGLGPAFVPNLIVASAPTGVRQVVVAGGRGLHRTISIVHRKPVRSDTVALVLDELRSQVAAPATMHP